MHRRLVANIALVAQRMAQGATSTTERSIATSERHPPFRRNIREDQRHESGAALSLTTHAHENKTKAGTTRCVGGATLTWTKGTALYMASAETAVCRKSAAKSMQALPSQRCPEPARKNTARNRRVTRSPPHPPEPPIQIAIAARRRWPRRSATRRAAPRDPPGSSGARPGRRTLSTHVPTRSCAQPGKGHSPRCSQCRPRRSRTHNAMIGNGLAAELAPQCNLEFPPNASHTSPSRVPAIPRPR